MSIRFAPYTSKYQHAGMKIYHTSANSGSLGIIYRTSNNALQVDQVVVPINDKEWVELHHIILDADDGFQHERKRKYILPDFAYIIKKITDTFKATIWKTLKASPLVTIHELLWLKVDDVDGRVGHLEKMLMQLMEDNQHLQHRLDLLEKSLVKGYLEKMLLQVIEENKLIQRRIDALEQKELLYELD